MTRGTQERRRFAGSKNDTFLTGSASCSLFLKNDRYAAGAPKRINPCDTVGYTLVAAFPPGKARNVSLDHETPKAKEKFASI